MTLNRGCVFPWKCDCCRKCIKRKKNYVWTLWRPPVIETERERWLNMWANAWRKKVSHKLQWKRKKVDKVRWEFRCPGVAAWPAAISPEEHGAAMHSYLLPSEIWDGKRYLKSKRVISPPHPSQLSCSDSKSKKDEGHCIQQISAAGHEQYLPSILFSQGLVPHANSHYCLRKCKHQIKLLPQLGHLLNVTEFSSP